MKFLLFCGIYTLTICNFFAKTFTLQEYGEMLQTIEIIAKESIQKKDYKPLLKELQRIPEQITVVYTVQDKTIQKKTYLLWLKSYLNDFLAKTITEDDKAITEILENAQEESNEGKIIPIAEKVQKLIVTLQDMRQELLLMGYKSKDESDIKNKLNTIFDKKFEDENKKTKKNNWLSEKLENIYYWLNKNFKALKNIWNWFLLAILVAAIIFIAIKVSKYIKNTQQFVEETSHQGLLQADDPRNSKELIIKAKEYEQKGDFRMAVRYYYVAFIIELEEQEILSYQPYFTNWEYQRKLLSMGYSQEEIYHLTAYFDKVWYGMYPVTNVEYQHYTLNYEKIKNILATAKA